MSFVPHLVRIEFIAEAILRRMALFLLDSTCDDRQESIRDAKCRRNHFQFAALSVVPFFGRTKEPKCA